MSVTVREREFQVARAEQQKVACQRLCWRKVWTVRLQRTSVGCSGCLNLWCVSWDMTVSRWFGLWTSTKPTCMRFAVWLAASAAGGVVTWYMIALAPVRNPRNSSEPVIFTGIKPILHVFGESPMIHFCIGTIQLLSSLSFKSRLTSCHLKIDFARLQ